MPTLGSKRQVTLPGAPCRELDVHPGDELAHFRTVSMPASRRTATLNRSRRIRR